MVTRIPAAIAARMARTSRSCGRPLVSSSVPSRSTARSTLRAGSGLGVDRDLALRARAPLVLHDAVDQREERVVLGDADVAPRVNRSTDLADQDAAGGDALAAVDLGPAALRVGVAAVTCAACTLLVSHDVLLLRSGHDVEDLESRVRLPVTVLAAVVLAAAELEHDELLS